MNEIKSIQTRYAGCHFRSRLEARYAVFLDALGIKWEYEMEGYDLGGLGYYLPDFFLKELNYFIEIKGISSTEIERLKCEKLSELHDVFLFDSGLGIEDESCSSTGATPSAIWYSGGHYRDYPVKFLKCEKCGKIDIAFDGWTHYSRRCKCYDDNNRDKMGSFHPDILSALNAAKSARFEHGESGAT
jgi:hypothetical protein